ncbi:MAG: fatty acid desaturase [Planctomycetota bacterium]|nr:fatty acid desaturase [Planctomycetota bacterium]
MSHELAHDLLSVTEQPVPLTTKQIHLAMLSAVVFPPLGVIAAMVMLWGGLFYWTDLFLLLGMYAITGLGITIGYHRLVTHKAFTTPTPLAMFFIVCGAMAAQGPVIWWAATHRRHHQHSDCERDPHSPHVRRTPGFVGWIAGFMHAHFGWLFRDSNDNNYSYVPDLLNSPSIRRVNRLFPLCVAFGLILPGIIGGLVTMTWTGALLGTVWGGFARMFLLHHVTWSINSVCHVWGMRDYQCNDESRNNPIMGILAFGEGWHNNHHAFPTSARHGLKWWQIDMSWMIIRSLQVIGLAQRVRLPTRERMAARERAPSQSLDTDHARVHLQCHKSIRAQ